MTVGAGLNDACTFGCNLPRVLLLLLAGLLAGPGSAAANDSAANYSQSAGNWRSNAHRGDIWSADWSREASSESWSAAGHFIGSSTFGTGDIDSDGKSFAMFANPSGDPQPFAAAVKRFARPVWTTDDVVTFQVSVNFRNGNKGFNLRDANGQNVWLFSVRNDAYYINSDNTTISGYHANTVFTFTFTQRARVLEWTIVRSGGISGTFSGSSPIESGTIADIRFFITGTDPGDANNLYFNNFTFTPAVRGDAPLTLGERRFPGHEPSFFLRFEDPLAEFANFRSENDWNLSYGMTHIGSGVWELDIRDVGLAPGFHRFKFRMQGGWESGPNRHLYIRPDGKIGKPPAVYLTWQRDPTTTMTVHWHTVDPADTGLRMREAGESTWQNVDADSTVSFPYTERWVQTGELTGLAPATVYEFEVDGYEETYSFRTMPATLDEPVRGAFTGDILYGEAAEAMAATMAALDPAFLMIGGDLSYSDGRADHVWMEYRYFEHFHTRFRAPDGRLIPIIVGIGNHEVKKAYLSSYINPEDTPAWRDREAPFFFRPYAFPGDPGYNVLDFADYLSLVVLDTGHVNPVEGAQTDWLAARLDERRHVRHLLPVYHVPAYPSHRSSQATLNVAIRQHWLPLFEDAGVHLAFEHHDHTFKRTPPLLENEIDADGIVFLGDGAWGVDIRTVKETEGRHDLQVAASRRHAYLATFTATGRTVQAVDVDGVVFDEISQIGDGIPPVPVGLVPGQVFASSVEFSWQPSARARSYRVLRDDIEIGTTTTTHFRDTGRTPNTSAEYRVVAVNRSGASAPSPSLLLATLDVPPVPQAPAAPDIAPLSASAMALQWASVPHAESYTIFRDDVKVATAIEALSFADGELTPDTDVAYRLRADNMSGSSPLSPPATARTHSPHVPFVLDGLPETPGYLLDAPGMTIYAAIRGTELYVATWTPAGGNSDHFIFVSDHLLDTAARRAPWNKKGFTAHPSGQPYLGAESTASDYIAWYHVPSGGQAFRSPTGGERIEGVFDLVEVYGGLPDILYIATAAYGTEDLESLKAQAPAGNGNENIEPDEFFAIPAAALRDSLGVGVYDRLDPAREFRVEDASRPTGGFTVRWRSVPGRAYWVSRSTDEPFEEWTRLTDTPIVAPSGADELNFIDPLDDSIRTAAYRVELAD